MSVDVIGLHEANRALRKLPEFAKAEAQQVMDVTAFQVAQRAKAAAPVLTGTLQRAITWQRRERSLSAVAGIDNPHAFHWKFVEYGTVRMAARPFWRPAAEGMADDHHRRLMQALEKTLTQVEREAK